ncbi:hypothetical protein GBAR_LOCUS22571 [Geodia barretti]|uniref:Uncharacterized protein n=1 Tax=Geodia barretti TaxID=519541 RepID=A0AA35T3W0_GEOBA|nr:hypothetical protein GBAR_LOCUS22571 [Geodia barretti]
MRRGDDGTPVGTRGAVGAGLHGSALPRHQHLPLPQHRRGRRVGISRPQLQHEGGRRRAAWLRDAGDGGHGRHGAGAGVSPSAWLSPAGLAHKAAVKRLFLEACKRATGAEVAAQPMRVYDKKNDLTIDATAVGDGRYRIAAAGSEGNDKAAQRVDGVTRGLIKLAELEPGAEPGEVRFPCGFSHDELVGLLIGRALNVRAAMREAEAAAARGILAAPSAQQQT